MGSITSNKYLRQIQKVVTFMKMTEQVATMSYDTKHRVGSILIHKDFSNVAAIGYNGNYRGGENKRESEESGMSGFLHAEENALLKANVAHPENHILFVTMTPCRMCAKRIVNKGVGEVIYMDEYTNGGDIAGVFREGGVTCRSLADKLLTLFVVTDMFADAQGKVRELLDGEAGIEDIELVLFSLMLTQLKAYFGSREVNLCEVDFQNVLTPQMTIEQMLRLYAQHLLGYLYRLS